MNNHTTIWPSAQMSDVLVSRKNGAWFVNYSDEQGVHQLVRKSNSKPKGFRRMDQVVLHLRNRQGIDTFNAEAR